MSKDKLPMIFNPSGYYKDDPSPDHSSRKVCFSIQVEKSDITRVTEGEIATFASAFDISRRQAFKYIDTICETGPILMNVATTLEIAETYEGKFNRKRSLNQVLTGDAFGITAHVVKYGYPFDPKCPFVIG